MVSDFSILTRHTSLYFFLLYFIVLYYFQIANPCHLHMLISFSDFVFYSHFLLGTVLGTYSVLAYCFVKKCNTCHHHYIILHRILVFIINWRYLFFKILNMIWVFRDILHGSTHIQISHYFSIKFMNNFNWRVSCVYDPKS